MGQSIKDKLKEKQKQNHEEFRKQLVDDVSELFRQWKEHAEYYNTKRISEYADTSRKMESLCDEAKEIEGNLKEMRRTTIREIEKLQKVRTRNQYIYFGVLPLIGSLAGIFIYELDWPAILSIFTW